MPFGGIQDILNVVMAVLYGLMLFFAIFQFSRIVCNKHQLYSFHSAFLLLCFVWMLLRTLLFVLLLATDSNGSTVDPEGPLSDPTIFARGDIPVPLFFFIAYVPLELEFATYTLLILFFARVACKLDPSSKSLWDERYKRRFFGTWIFANVAIFVSLVTIVSLLAVGHLNQGDLTFRVTRTLTTAVIFSLLVILLGYYGYRLYTVLQDPMVRYIPFQSRGTTVPGITLLTGLLLVVFLCRAVYCIVLAIEYLDHPTFVGEEPLFRFLSLLISELLPTFAILVFFRRIPTSRVRRRQLIPPVFYSGIQDAVRKIKLFFVYRKTDFPPLLSPPKTD